MTDENKPKKGTVGRPRTRRAEKKIPINACVKRETAEALTALARLEKISRGQLMQRILEREAERFRREQDGRRGELLAEIFNAAREIAVIVFGSDERIERYRGAATQRPSLIFPLIIEFCAAEMPRVLLNQGRDAYERCINEAMTRLTFQFPEELTAPEVEAFERFTSQPVSFNR